MIRKVKIAEVPPKRGVSAVTKKMYAEFENLKRELNKNSLQPYEAEMVVLEIAKAKPQTIRNATLKLLKMTTQFIQKERLPYKAFTRRAGTEMYVVGKEPARQAA